MSVELLGSLPTIVRDGTPAHEQIEKWLDTAIRAGHVESGQRLPSERTLSAALGVSRMTLRQALAALERNGQIMRSPGGAGASCVAG